MAPKKQGKAHVNRKLSEIKQVTKCLRQRLSWCNRTGQTYDPNLEQYSIFPRAIVDENGHLRKGVKATWKDKIGKRYEQLKVVTNFLPQGWTPETVVFDAMFLINCKPLRNSSAISDYATLLFNRFFLPHFENNCEEVHIVFDAPNKQHFNPKIFEQTRRDQGHCSTKIHEHIDFTPHTKPPPNWREFIECRKCKRSIIEAISLAYLQNIRFRLRRDQHILISGVFELPYSTSGDG